MFFKLYGQNITPSCEICEHSKTDENQNLTCHIKGTVLPTDKCRRFRYDPLKREPRLPKELESFDNDDFSLDT